MPGAWSIRVSTRGTVLRCLPRRCQRLFQPTSGSPSRHVRWRVVTWAASSWQRVGKLIVPP
ncbi:hypothetical protein DVH24_038158 [Malus domestica]|uniref:Uncharacterized protein n=1 Tax=Malus domestica TaxID=3750 RepID=A0A498KBY1_MALDO|nr:hypothetical protein DVH24_038158 [Malus domestica]